MGRACQEGRSLGLYGFSCRVLESRRLESTPKAAVRLDLEVAAWWVSLSSRGLWGGDALLLSTDLSAEPKP